MNVLYRDRAKRWKESFPLLEQATERLEQIVSSDVDAVSAEWDRTTDADGRPVYVLRLSDWSGAVSAVLSPWELESSERLRLRLQLLWGDLLAVRSKCLLEGLMGGGEERR